MATPPRAPRHRGASQRWLIIPFVLTVLVLLIDASMHARSPKLQRALTQEAWLDAVIPQITSSTTLGAEITGITRQQFTGTAADVAQQLSSIASQAAAAYRSVRSAVPPADMATAAGFLDACFAAREEGAAGLATAVSHLVQGVPSTAVLAQMTSATSDIQLGDNAYRLFAVNLPNVGLTMPSSRWDGPGQYGTLALSTFSQRLLAAMGKSPARPLTIDAVSTEPRPLNIENGVGVVTQANPVSVIVVVANTTQSPEDGVNVSVVLAPGLVGATQTVSRAIGLAAGQSYAVTLPGLQLRPSTISTLTVTADLDGHQEGTQQLRVVAPGPNFQGVPSTSSTTTSTGTVNSTTKSTTAAGVATTTTTTVVAGTAVASTTTSTTATTAP